MSIPIVVCDDSGMARKQIARALPAGWDIELSFAANGAEALDVVRAGKAELMFLDLTMPVLDGYQTLEAIAAEHLPVKVIVVSGDIQQDARRRVMELGALEFIKKPVDETLLANVLKQFDLLGAPAGGERGEVVLDVDIRDCYREITNIAIGRAAALLAKLLDVFVILPVPNVNTLDAGELHMALAAAENYERVSAVCQGYIGYGIAGEALLIFNDASFNDIARLMKFDGELNGSVELELLMDISNILIGACLKGLADQLDIHFSQGHPTVLGRHCKVADLIAANRGRWKQTLAIEINFQIEAYNINCDLLLLFTEDSVQPLNQRIAHLFDV